MHDHGTNPKRSRIVEFHMRVPLWTLELLWEQVSGCRTRSEAGWSVRHSDSPPCCGGIELALLTPPGAVELGERAVWAGSVSTGWPPPTYFLRLLLLLPGSPYHHDA